MTATIKDVAKAAGVSISTVSRVLNNSKPVSEDARNRVLEVIAELDYRPNPTARNLVLKQSNLIGVLVTDISSSFVGSLLNAIEEIAKVYNYDIILCNSYGSEEQEKHYFELMQSKQVEGIILFTSRINDFHKNTIGRMGIPTVVVNRDASKLGFISVTIDYKSAFYELTNYLISQGHKRIAMMKLKDDIAVFAEEQYSGYKQAHEENGIKIVKNLEIYSDYRYDDAYNSMINFIESKKTMPTAIIASTDDMAIGVMNALIDKGYKIPEDVSVCGTYDSKLSRMCRPQLTSIVHPTYDIGAIAMRLLIKKIKGNSPKSLRHDAPHSVVIRESTRKI